MEAHKTYLDTTGRTVLVFRKTNLVEQHIQEFEVASSSHSLRMRAMTRCTSTSTSASVPANAHTRPCQCAPLLARLASPRLASTAMSCSMCWYISVSVHVHVDPVHVQPRADAARAPDGGVRVPAHLRDGDRHRSTRLLSHQGTFCTLYSVQSSVYTTPHALVRSSIVDLVSSALSRAQRSLSPAFTSGCAWHYSTRTVHLTFVYVRAFYTDFVRVSCADTCYRV